jgi:Fe-S cluster biosynthesis and repair protein YggX
MKKLKRVYHHIDLWEEVKHNMWGEVDDVKSALQQAINFTSDYKLYGYYMMKVVKEWKYSCENALTDDLLNKKAWLGHCAVALALRIPEDITRKAWRFLTDEQRLLANEEAERAITFWKRNYLEDKEIHSDMGEPMLPFGDTR